MGYTDEQLKELRKKLNGRENLNKTLRTLLLKKEEVEKRLDPLEKSRNKEQADIEKLEKSGIKSLFYSLTGQKVEKLNKEKNEAYEAQKKYDAVYKEYSAICDNLEFYLNELKELDECEKTLDTLIGEKKLDMKKAGHPLTEEIEKSEKMLLPLSKEIQSAEQAFYTVKEMKERMADLYDNIETLYYATRDRGCEWRSVDFMFGGSVKSGKTLSELFSEQLKKLEEQAAVLTYSYDKIKAELKELRTFADRMLLLFSSSSALAPVHNIYEKAKENKDRVSSLEFMLIEVYDEKRREYFDVKGKLTDLVIDTEL
ncbi:MAG: hypothetical protein E7490_00540 [Ruminococcaceae bacterium]|nr:hypothetical protein [Oscillospiraceae bacterium]